MPIDQSVFIWNKYSFHLIIYDLTINDLFILEF